MYTNLQFKTNKKIVFILFFTALLLIFSAFPAKFTHAEQPMMSNAKVQTTKNFLNVIILGDSLAVGYENGFTTSSVPYGFSEHIYEQAMFQGYRTTMTNYGIIGLNSKGLLNWLGAASQQKSITADQLQAGLKDPRLAALLNQTEQLQKDVENADVIVLAIGGNDFLGILAALDLTKDVSSMSSDEKTALIDKLQQATDQYIINLSEIITHIHQQNPEAIIVTQNQYLPLPKFVINGDIYYPSDIIKTLAPILIEAQTTLNNKFEEVMTEANKSGVSIGYIDATKVIDDNALGLTGIASGDVHPNTSGYAKLGEAYANLLWGEFKKPGTRKADNPLTVVVNGKEVVSKYPTKVINGRTYLVLRDVTDAVGATLTWDNKTKSATVALNDRTVKFTVGSNSYTINGKSYPLDAPMFNATIGKENKTYLPVAALSSGLDLFVQYRSQLKTVFVNN